MYDELVGQMLRGDNTTPSLDTLEVYNLAVSTLEDMNTVELRLRAAASERYLDYDSIAESNMSYGATVAFKESEDVVITEGIVSGIWKAICGLARNAVKIIISIWKGIVAVVKAIAKCVLRLFGIKVSNYTFDTPRMVSLATMESVTLKSYEINSMKELKNKGMKAIHSLGEEIKERSSVQLELTEKYEAALRAAEQMAVKEAKIVHGRSVYNPYQRFLSDDEMKMMDDKFSNDKLIDRIEKDHGVKVSANDKAAAKALSISTLRNPENRMASMTSSDITGSAHASNPGSFDRARYVKALKADNLVEEYKKLIDWDIDDILRGRGARSIMEILWLEEPYRMLTEEYGRDPKEIRDFMISNYYIQPKTRDEAKRLIQLRLNYNKKLVSVLENMVRVNYEAMGLTAAEAEEYLESLDRGDNSKINGIYERIMRLDWTKYRIADSDCYDFHKFGLGAIYISSQQTDLVTIKDVIRSMISMATRWDCVVLGHGMSKIRTTKDNNEQRKEWEALEKLHNKEFARVKDEIEQTHMDWNDYLDSHPDFKELHEKYNEMYRTIDEWKKDKSKLVWAMQPIKVPGFPNEDKVDTVVRNLISYGYKKIYLCVCNAPGFELADDIKHTRGVVVRAASHVSLV
jgi:hypothetical protein